MRVACVAIGLAWAACAGAEVHYRLPWPEGRAFMFTQVPGGQITTHFTKATLHAVDIAMPEGVPVLAARAGIVEAAQAHHRAGADEEPLTYEGNFVRVRHADGTAATDAHLRYQSVTVTVGETIEAAQLLGYSGASGDVIEPHLHFVVTRTQRNSSGWREEVRAGDVLCRRAINPVCCAGGDDHHGELLARCGTALPAERRRAAAFSQATDPRGAPTRRAPGGCSPSGSHAGSPRWRLLGILERRLGRRLGDPRAFLVLFPQSFA